MILPLPESIERGACLAFLRGGFFAARGPG
jgi:hypothetical protein